MKEGKMSITNNQIKAFIERIERVEDERKLLNEDIKDIYKEAKSEGYNTKIIKKIIARRRRSSAARPPVTATATSTAAFRTGSRSTMPPS